MASVTALEVLRTARTLLNDDSATTFNDPSLFPKLAQAHRELQAKLRFANSPIMKTEVYQTVNSDTANPYQLILPDPDMIEPITLWEAPAGATTGFSDTPMTEKNPLPLVNPLSRSTLEYWSWAGHRIIGGDSSEYIAVANCNVNRTIRCLFWRRLPIPDDNNDPILVMHGELYLAPRVAALAAGSVGNEAVFNFATNMAKEALTEVIQVNRGNLKPAEGTRMRP